MASKYELYEAHVSSYEKHPDQGLKAAKKKLQKDPKNIVLLLAQTRYLQRLGRDQDALNSIDAIKAGAKDALEVPMIVEIQDITAKCQESLGTFSCMGGPKLSSLWKDALDQTPKQGSKRVQSEMFRAALYNEYWDLAQQLFARLQKESPKISRYHYAWVVLSQIQAEKMPPEDKMGQSLKMLAYRSLKAAIDNTIAGKDTPRIIVSANELRLIASIYRRQGYDKDLLNLLNSTEIGIESPVGKNDIEFIRVKIELLKKLERWEELNSFCLSSLDKLCQQTEQKKSAAEDIPTSLAWADDWYIWDNATTSSSKLEFESSKKVVDLCNRYLAVNPKNRNAGRALLLNRPSNTKAALLDECKRFFDLHKSNRSCFEDLRQFLQGLVEQDQNEFEKYVSAANSTDPLSLTNEKDTSAWILATTNALKIRYLLCISKPGTATLGDVERFVTSCLTVFMFSASIPTDSGDDVYILAITALLKLANGFVDSTTTSSITPIVQAAYLTEFLHEESTENSKATLLSLLISQLLGLGSISISAFQDLSLREVQFDTLSHLLYSRISSSHPFGVDLRSTKALDDRHKNPLDGMTFALQWPKKAIETTTKFMAKDMEHVYFDKIMEFSDFKERVETSFTRVLLQLERRRVARMTEHSSVLDEPLMHFEKAKSDNRDFYSIPDFEHKGAEPFEIAVVRGPKPGVFWLAWWSLNDLLQTLTMAKSTLPASQQRILFDSIIYLQSHQYCKARELTRFEQDILHGWGLMQPLVISLFLDPKSPHAAKDVVKGFDLLLDFVNTARLPFTSLEQPMFPNWTFFHTRFLHLELFKAYDKLSDAALVASKQKAHHAFGKVPVETILKIKSDLRSVVKLIQSQGREMKLRLEKNGEKEILKLMRAEGDIGAAVEDLLGEAKVRDYGKRFAESAIEALDGLSKVRV